MPKIFLLTETVDREIGVALFPTCEAAQKTMKELYEAVIEEHHVDDDDCDITDYSAWANTSDFDYDLTIFDLDKIDENSLQP